MPLFFEPFVIELKKGGGMPYEVLLKKAHELVDAAPPKKLEWMVGVLEGEDSAKKTKVVSDIVKINRSIKIPPCAEKSWSREALYER